MRELLTHSPPDTRPGFLLRESGATSSRAWVSSTNERPYQKTKALEPGPWDHVGSVRVMDQAATTTRSRAAGRASIRAHAWHAAAQHCSATVARLRSPQQPAESSSPSDPPDVYTRSVARGHVQLIRDGRACEMEQYLHGPWPSPQPGRLAELCLYVRQQSTSATVTHAGPFESYLPRQVWKGDQPACLAPAKLQIPSQSTQRRRSRLHRRAASSGIRRGREPTRRINLLFSRTRQGSWTLRSGDFDAPCSPGATVKPS